MSHCNLRLYDYNQGRDLVNQYKDAYLSWAHEHKRKEKQDASLGTRENEPNGLPGNIRGEFQAPWRSDLN